MHLDDQAKRALEIGAGAYAMHHAVKGTPLGQEGSPVATAARIGGNVMVGWVLFKFVLLPLLAISALICFGPALLVLNGTRHHHLVECTNIGGDGHCVPLSVSGNGNARDDDPIRTDGSIGPLPGECFPGTATANAPECSTSPVEGYVAHQSTYDWAPIILLGLIGGLVWLRFPFWWFIRSIRDYDRVTTGRDLKTGKRPQVVSPEPVYYAQPQPAQLSKYLAEDGSYVVHRS